MKINAEANPNEKDPDYETKKAHAETVHAAARAYFKKMEDGNHTTFSMLFIYIF